MTELIKAVSEAGLGLGSLFLISYLLITLSMRQDKKDKAYIETLLAMQTGMTKFQADLDKNWALTQDISKAVQSTVNILSQLKCVGKHDK